MMSKNFPLSFVFLIGLVWTTVNLKKASTRLQFEEFNQPVKVQVVDLPLCGRSGVIVVEYKNKKYHAAIGRTDCLAGKYRMDDTLDVIYNSRLDEMNPNLLMTYRGWLIFTIIVFILFILLVFLPSEIQITHNPKNKLKQNKKIDSAKKRQKK